MNVSELYDLTQWITREIEQAQIPQKYQALHTILQQHAQPNQQRQPFEAQKEELFKVLNNVPINQLTRDQIEFLSHLGIAESVGAQGIETIEDILYKNVIDVATSASKLQQIIQKLNEGIQKSKQIQTGLTDCVFEEEYEAENEVLMRVSFTGHALMKNVSDFKSWGNIWYDIGRGIAMVHNASPEEVKIVGATKGSIVIELAVIAKIAATASGIILAALKVAEKVLDIRKKAEKLKGLKLKNDKVIKDLEQEAENEKKSGIEEITGNISGELKIKKNGEGDKVKALDTAVKNLVNFVEEGGVVDFIEPKDSEDIDEEQANENQKLRVAFQEIRQLENKLSLLEHKDP
ncbi:MAG: hypothetical protein OI74_11250 [Gammaproteobacteria bacterium (ex Lamellibrachia satsuma)]|nr:MAG: hypothetical protein HPY30_13975 [Gammaproteobacteria bacterium (ex Lamellibrachia satsuma)]RRS32491.1 MAG: hypothetical protein OI74_11250 [Gammaproteobacteria bacterium (ex Lamellibrachia satsuma)]RRS35441.1 MAG: hypothetical protein NV67_10455 [Gammaproteobacteria bacterium (ex Lamellibrachia satsuma)]